MPWADTAIFYALTPVDIGVLLAVGVLWSAALWTLTEGVKTRLDLRKPYLSSERRALLWGPVVGSAGLTVVVLPLVVEGLGQPMPLSVSGVVVSMIVGSVGGMMSKAAHDVAGDVFLAILNRVVEVIRGSGS